MSALLNRSTFVLFAIVLTAALPTCTRAGKQSSTADLNSRVPDWVPIYPGAVLESTNSKPTGAENFVNISLKTHDPPLKVIEWYEGKLHEAGYNTSRGANDDRYALLQSDGPGRTRSIKLQAAATADSVEIAIQAVERNVGGSSVAATVPNWVPVYPRTAPAHMEARKSHDEYHLAFSFTSTDDPKKVYSWYKTKLEALGFQVSFDVTPGSGGLFSNTFDNRRSFNMRNYPRASESTFTVELMDRSGTGSGD